jgi:hypothetical protein
MTISLKSCPPAGGGCHQWLYYVINQLHRMGIMQDAVEEIIWKIVEELMSRDPQPGEIENTIATVYGGNGEASGKLAWLGKPDPVKISATFNEYPNVSTRTWVDLSDPVRGQEEILRWAFNPDELICTGTTLEGRWPLFVQTLDETIAGATERQFIVPSPFISRQGVTKDGKPTIKSDSQVRFRRFLVIEFDLRGLEQLRALPMKEKLDYQARLHWALSRQFPLAMIIYSGSESLHGWYNTRRPEQLMMKAVSLGADRALWILSQFTRIPLGRHANGQLQRVIYWKRCQFTPILE